MADQQSVTSFVMAATLPWPDDAPPADRLGVLDPVALYEGGSAQPCSVRKISPLGATIRGAGARTVGQEVAIELATGHRAPGTIAWAVGDEAGVRFKQPIDMVAPLLLEVARRRIERGGLG